MCTPFVLVRSAYAACTLSTASNTFTVTSSCAFDGSVDGVDADSGVADKNGAVLKVAQNQTLTVSANQTLAVGSLNMSGATSGKIVLLSGAQIKPGAAVYMTDSDNDHIPSGTTQVLVPNNGAGVSGTISKRKYTVTNPTATDCNDSISGHNNTLPSAVYYIDSDSDTYTSGSGNAGAAICSNASTWNDTSGASGISSSGSTNVTTWTGKRLAAANGSDCNDNSASVYQNLTGYTDADNDTYTVGGAGSICSGASLASGYRAAANGADCNDANASIYQILSGYTDADGDGYGTFLATYNSTCLGATNPYSANTADACDETRSVDNFCPVIARMNETTSTNDTVISIINGGRSDRSCLTLTPNAPVAYGPVGLSSPYLNSYTRNFSTLGQGAGSFQCESGAMLIGVNVQKLTMTAWIWIDPAIPSGGGPWGIYNSGTSYVIMRIISPNLLRFAVNSAYTGTVPISYSTWHRIAVVFDGLQTGNANRVKMYVDGVQQTVTFVGTFPASLPTGGVGLLTIGSWRSLSGASYSFYGYMDDFRLYPNSALTLPQLENAWANQ